MNNIEIKDAMQEAIVARGMFLVDVSVSADNDVTLTVESREGSVSLDDCAAVSQLFEATFDREKEDYSLTVSSAGLDQPFKVLDQYRKAVGTKVEASLKGGRKLIATLEEADENGLTIRYQALEKPEGSKKKVAVEHCEHLGFELVNSVRPYVEFE